MILAIDQGTTSTRALVFDAGGAVRGSAGREFTQHFPQPGWVEHDATEIWESVLETCRAALDEAGVQGRDLAAIGITNQRETSVAWDRDTGRPIGPAIVWQDRRTAARCEELRAAGHEPLFAQRTGLVLDPYFSGTKYAWLLEHHDVPASVALGTIDAYLVFMLTGLHATDPSNASRTLLLDLDTVAYDAELCDLLGVPGEALPEVIRPGRWQPTTTAFGGEVPVAAVIGDQQASLFGQTCGAAGMAKNTYGTGSFVLRSVGPERPPSSEEVVTTIAWDRDDTVDYALESSIFATGAAVQWLRDGLGIIADAAETEALAAGLDGNDDIYFVPALAGLGSPVWDPRARGTIVGLTRGATRAHLARATLEAIAYQSADALDAQARVAGEGIDELRVDGGATQNGWLMQFQADVLGVPVVASGLVETTAAGAAYRAGIATGLWTQDDVRAQWSARARWEPRMSEDERASLRADWARAVERSRDWAAA